LGKRRSNQETWRKIPQKEKCAQRSPDFGRLLDTKGRTLTRLECFPPDRSVAGRELEMHSKYRTLATVLGRYRILKRKDGLKHMFGKKKSKVKSGPTDVKGVLARVIGDAWGNLPRTEDHWVDYKAVMRPRSEGPNSFDVRIYDQWYTRQMNISVVDYQSLDEHQGLILLDGWVDMKAKKGEIRPRAK
jgi:hypothetical protein